jgi:hypothetical protein
MSASNERLDNILPLAQKDLPDQAELDSREISDADFMADLQKLRYLRSFLIEQAVQLKPSESAGLSFGTLNLLRFSGGGRSPTRKEWEALETLTQDLFRHLSDPLRRRFLYSRLPWWVPQLVVTLGIVAILSLVGCTLAWGIGGYNRILPLYVLWLASLGAIGSISFIGMNALSVQDDATFDLSSTKLLVLRISLGALFGVVLTLPFGFYSFINFIKLLVNGGEVSTQGLTAQSILLLLPFILGFSTSLVIMILNQFVDAIQSFFGRKAVPANTSHDSSTQGNLPKQP